MLRKALLIGLSVGVCVAVFLLRLMAQESEHEGLTVRVSVQASDSHPLNYQWRSTDGVIQNVNASTTTWTLPRGPGLHFAYVLVSNGLGGYTERRLAINTDSFAGEKSETEARPLNAAGENEENESEEEARPLSAPPAPTQQGDYFRSFVSQ